MIDSHCHLADETFATDLDEVIRRAREAGLERALVILEAGNAKEAAQAGRLEQFWPGVRFSIGVHPHQAHEFADEATKSRLTADLEAAFGVFERRATSDARRPTSGARRTTHDARRTANVTP